MKYPVNEIPINEMGRKSLSSGSITTGASILSLAMMLFICAIPVQQGWNNSDMLFCRIIAIPAVMGAAMCLMVKSYIKFGLTDILVVILYAYFIFRYNADSVYPAEAMTIHATLAISLYFSLRLLFTGCSTKGNVVTFLLLAFAIYEAGYGIVQLIEGSSRHLQYPVTGSFHNPGPYSISLVIGFVIICGFMKNPRLSGHIPPKRDSMASIAIQTLAMIFVALMTVTVSRTAFIATALCMFIMFWNRMGRWKWLAPCLCMMGCVGLYLLKSGSADGRMVINYVGAHAMADNPVFGNGAGSFFHKFAEATQRLALSETTDCLYAVDVVEYAFNDWLKILVELGIIGFAMSAAIAFLTFRNLWKSNVTLPLVFLVIIVFSLFSYPMEMLPYRIISIIIISFAASKVKDSSERCNGNRNALVATLFIALTVACIPFTQTYRIKEFAEAEKDYNMMRGIDDPALIKDYASVLPLLEENRDFLFDYGRMLSKEGRYNDSNHIMRRGAMISNDPMFLVIMGNNYRDLEAFDEAERMYLKAWHTMPNRIYPIYRLMLLYQQTGKGDKAAEYADIIVNFKEKIPSPAVRDIKREAQEIINTNSFLWKGGLVCP